MTIVKIGKRLAVAGMFALATLVGVGCDKGESTGQTDQPKGGSSTPQATAQPKAATKPVIPIAQALDWCREHAMPESICVQCDTSLAAGFKAKGDWCEEHNVPNSQDFAHNPELKEKFAAAFKEKYGKDAPAMEEEGEEEEGKE